MSPGDVNKWKIKIRSSCGASVYSLSLWVIKQIPKTAFAVIRGVFQPFHCFHSTGNKGGTAEWFRNWNAESTVSGHLQYIRMYIARKIERPDLELIT